MLAQKAPSSIFGVTANIYFMRKDRAGFAPDPVLR